MDENDDGMRRSVLIIDDEEVIRHVCVRVLSRESYFVEEAADVHAAMDLITGREFDLYIMDIKLPGASGIELYNWMLEKYPEQAKRVIVITGTGLDTDTLKFLEGFPNPVLHKPFTVEELKTAVREFF
ncbi:MAG: response regulator [Dehalococcoidales bacterium]|nr:response regulator [Dehalococcoidales bacterium]